MARKLITRMATCQCNPGQSSSSNKLTRSWSLPHPKPITPKKSPSNHLARYSHLLRSASSTRLDSTPSLTFFSFFFLFYREKFIPDFVAAACDFVGMIVKFAQFTWRSQISFKVPILSSSFMSTNWLGFRQMEDLSMPRWFEIINRSHQKVWIRDATITGLCAIWRCLYIDCHKSEEGEAICCDCQ